jgi:hypothetical protein
VTPPPFPPPLLEPLAPAVGASKSPQLHDGHAGRFGALMVVCVAASSEANRMSALSPTCT